MNPWLPLRSQPAYMFSIKLSGGDRRLTPPRLRNFPYREVGGGLGERAVGIIGLDQVWFQGVRIRVKLLGVAQQVGEEALGLS